MGFVHAHTQKSRSSTCLLDAEALLREKQELSSVSVMYLLRACRGEEIYSGIPWKTTCLITGACSGSYLGLIKATAMQISIYNILVENGCLKQIVPLKVILVSY